MKKLLFLLALLLNAVWASAQYSGSGNGTESDPYLIYNETQLYQMNNFLGSSNAGVVFKLMKDLDLTDFISENFPSEGWMPVGVESTPFQGKFYGNNHTISGLWINRTSTDNIGLFGYVSGATINDLTLHGSKISGKANVGGLVGYATSSTVANCHTEFDGVSGSAMVGGLIGLIISTSVTQTGHIGNVSGSSSHIGGLIGQALSSSAVTTCEVKSDVSGTRYVGGVLGQLGTSTIKESTNHGNVTGTGSVGGVVGVANGTGSLTNVKLFGDTKGTSNVGGIVGEIQTSSSISFSSCQSKGLITNTGDYTGGILGYNNGCIAGMDDCCHFGDVNGDNYVGGLVGYTGLSEDVVLHKYTFSNSNKSEKPDQYSRSYQETLTNNSKAMSITNCAAIGNLNGNNQVGGLIGFNGGIGLAITSYTGKSDTSDKDYIWIDGVYSGKMGTSLTYYTYKRTDLILVNSYYSGTIIANNNVAGIVGYHNTGTICKCYSNALIYGRNNIGGIAGILGGVSIVESNVAINAIVSATESNVGRIYGTIGQNVSIGTLGSSKGNRALTTTKVILKGVVQEVADDLQNGNVMGQSLLKLKANYVALGWDFDNNWDILETECFPYKKYQAAPPVIESDLVSQATEISGSSLNGGTVYLYYKDRDAVSSECNGNAWKFTTDKLQSGAPVQLYAEVDGLAPSYLTSATVGYPGKGTEADPYRIYTAEDLQGASNKGYYKLMNDIDLTSWINENSPTEGWVSIGRNSGEATNINGDGHKVTGLWINTTQDYTGLFSNFSAGVIKNLTVEVASGKKVKGGDYTGVLIGRNANGQILNCTIKGDVESNKSHFGGVAGCTSNTTIDNVYYEGTVTYNSNESIQYIFAGGLSGNCNDETVSNCTTKATINIADCNATSIAVGGLFGAGNATVSKCHTDVSITSKGKSERAKVGGLVGNMDGGTIDECFSEGNVACSINNATTGGLVGYSNTATISNSYSTADVTGTEFTAGLVAYSLGKIDKCYSAGNVNGVMYGSGVVGELDGANSQITNCVALNNTLTLTAESSWGCRVVGGFKNGAAEPGSTNYALSTMQVSLNGVPQKKTDDNIEGVAMTQNVLQDKQFYVNLGWNFTDVWAINVGKGYPYLKNIGENGNSEDPSGEDPSGEDPSGEDPAGGDPSNLEPSTDISAYTNTLYFNDVETSTGADLTLSLNMKNAEENITAFQCDVYLPAGVNWASTIDKRGNAVLTQPVFNTTTERTDASYHTISPVTQMTDGSYRIIVYSMGKETILDLDGAVLDLPLTISEDMEAGEYNIFIKNIVMTDVNTEQTLVEKVVSKLTIPSFTPGDVNDDKMINVTDVVAVVSYMLEDVPSPFIFKAADINNDETINVTDIVGIIDIINNPTSAKKAPKRMVKKSAKSDYSLEVVPFTVATGTTSKTATLDLINPEEDITAFQCDIYLPAGIDWASTTDRRGNITYTQPTFNKAADRTDDTYHTISPITKMTDGSFRIIVYSMKKEVFLDNAGAVIDLPLVFDAALAAGVYDVKVGNMVLTKTDVTQELPDDYTFSVLVGSPEIASATLHGDYTADAISELSTALASNTVLSAIDFTEATSVDASTKIETGNKNLLLYVNEGTSVKNTQNVVEGDECKSLVLTDGYNFAAPKAFTAVSASYSRMAPSTYGTTVLPFVPSTSGAEFYELTGVTPTCFEFQKVVSPVAGTPYLYRATTDNFTATNAEIAATEAGKVTASGWTMQGTYTKEVFDASDNVYAVSDDKVYCNIGTLTMNPFRAYFTGNTSSAPMNISIDGTTVIGSIESGELAIDGAAFNLAGQKVSKSYKGIVITNGKKEIRK